MQFLVIIAVIIGLILLIKFIQQRLFGDKPDTPPIEVDLVDNPISRAVPEETHEPSEKTIPIYKLNNIAEANTLKALLEENGIDCMVHSFMDYAYDGMWQSQKGWGVLKVLEKDKAKAEELINTFLKAKDQEPKAIPEETNQETPTSVGKPILPNIIFVASLAILLTIGVFIVIAIFAAYRESGRKLAEEGYYYDLRNEYDKAMEYYDKAINRGYNKSFVYCNKGIIKSQRGDFNGAISDFTKAIEIKPNDFIAYHNRGYAKDKKGDLDGAINDYTKAIEIKPDYASAYDSRGYAKDKKGDLNDAIKDYDNAIELNPESFYAWNNKGYVLNKLGRYEEAIKVLDKAIELKCTYAWSNKGYALNKLGKYKEAIKVLDKAIELDPKNADAWYNRACTYSLKNDKTNALEDLKKSISLEAKWKADAKKDDAFKWLWDDEEFKKIVE